MLSVLATGTLIADPIKRTSSAGKTFVTASLRTPTDDDAIIINVIAFDDAVVAALQKLQKGDSLSITGRATLKSWQARNGERTGLSVVADAILTAHGVRSKRSATKKAGTGAQRHDDRNVQDDDWIQP